MQELTDRLRNREAMMTRGSADASSSEFPAFGHSGLAVLNLTISPVAKEGLGPREDRASDQGECDG